MTALICMQISKDTPQLHVVSPYALRTMRTAAKPGPLEFYIGIVVTSVYGLQINSAGSDGLSMNPYVDKWSSGFGRTDIRRLTIKPYCQHPQTPGPSCGEWLPVDRTKHGGRPDS